LAIASNYSSYSTEDMRESLIDSIFSMTVYMLTGSRDVVNATNAVIGLSEPVLASSTSDYESASSSIKLYSFFYFEKNIVLSRLNSYFSSTNRLVIKFM
jgi:hypothetical protein